MGCKEEFLQFAGSCPARQKLHWSEKKKHFKGAVCGFGEDIQTQGFNVYEVIIQTQRCLIVS